MSFVYANTSIEVKCLNPSKGVYNSLGEILLMGDFNSRTGVLPDAVTDIMVTLTIFPCQRDMSKILSPPPPKHQEEITLTRKSKPSANN